MEVEAAADFKPILVRHPVRPGYKVVPQKLSSLSA